MMRRQPRTLARLAEHDARTLEQLRTQRFSCRGKALSGRAFSPPKVHRSHNEREPVGFQPFRLRSRDARKRGTDLVREAVAPHLNGPDHACPDAEEMGCKVNPCEGDVSLLVARQQLQRLASGVASEIAMHPIVVAKELPVSAPS